jgi:hypothetical protein
VRRADMRVISQDGKSDVPYERYSITVIKDDYCDIYHVTCDYSEKSLRKLAVYSTEAKAIKAMEMLREQYKALEVLKVLANGTAEHMEKSFKLDEFAEYNRAYRDMNVFQFPQDDEIEV